MSPYLIISIFLILISGILTYSKKTSKLRKKRFDFFSFYLTLIATFIGVFLAIEFTNHSEFRKEQKNVIKILDAISIDLSNNIYRVDGIYNVASLNFGPDSIFQIKKHIENNEIRLPRLFKGIADNELVGVNLKSIRKSIK